MAEKRDINSYLIRIDLLDIKTRKEFSLGYDTVKQARAFISRVKHGNKLIITGVSSWSSSAMEELRI